ncbi:nuclear transport factor 2 family protein [uncultured Muriicola sp.]|uniref:nuclear transport factor 2 family protein n=1 Tax=uncultured Muriicola sp. TaxID=1583102 RepID=UPI00260C13B7|nr:nuclear transport factor 2 family protein [uncultured Muriicola sp.]
MRYTLLLLFALAASSTWAQVDPTSELFITLQKVDSTLFEKGFNQCDSLSLKNSISRELRFYHDQSGIQDRKLFFENVENYICSNPQQKPIRRLEQGSLVVFPLYNNGILYGAIQHGVHHFYIIEEGNEDRWTSTAKFTHVWILEHDTFKLREALSYDHQIPRP